MVETFAVRNAGLTVEKLESEVLNLSAFSQCGTDFMHKVNSIRIQLAKGTWTPRKVQKPSANRNNWSPDSVAARHSVTAAVSDSTNPAVMAMRNRESVEGRVAAIRCSIASIKATFTDRMARFRDEFFFAAQREQIAKLEAELRQLGAGTPDVTEFPVSSGCNPDQRHAVGGAK